MADQTNNDPVLPPAKQGKKLAQPYFTTKQGQATLTGVSLSELAIRIKATDPKKSFSQARREARQLKQAQDTLTTGGGGFLANAKLGILRKTLGQNLGTKVSQALVSSKTQDKAAQALINFDSKNERVKSTESEATIKALQDQVEKLTKAVKSSTAVRVAQASQPVKVEKKVKEDLSDAVSALKALGFDMKEIKDRLSTLPRGLSTEDQIKHALKPTTERIKPAEVKAVVEETIKKEMQQVGTDTRTGKPRVRVLDTPQTAPVSATPVVSPTVEKPKSMLSDRIDELFKMAQPEEKTTAAVSPIRTPIKADEIVNKEKEDKDKEDKKDEKKDKEKKQSVVLKKLEAIQRGIKDLHSESFVGLLVMAIGALLVPLVKKIIEGVQWVRQKLQPLFDMITRIWQKFFPEIDPALQKKRDDRYSKAMADALSAEQSGDTNKATELRQQAEIAAMQDDEDDKRNREIRDEGIPTSAKEAAKAGKKSYLYQENGIERSHYLTPEDYKEAGVEPPPDYKPPKSSLQPVKPTVNEAKKRADDLEKASQEKSDASRTPTASTIVIPMPMKETQVAVPVSTGGGGDSSLAVLAARNDDPTTQNYIGTLFDHPATYGPLGRI